MHSHKGFTLIELLVVIAVIGLLASIVLVSVNNLRGKTRDTRRIEDLKNIAVALNLYYDTYDNWIEAGSGCGYSGNGNGWFNYTGISSGYPASIVQCLVDTNIISTEIIDPTGGRTSTPTSGFTYMKYSCSLGTYVYAKLENEPQSSTATDGTCCDFCDSSYGMNYYLQVE